MIIFIDMGNAKKYGKSASRNPKMSASAVSLGVFGTLVYFPNLLELANSIPAHPYASPLFTIKHATFRVWAGISVQSEF